MKKIARISTVLIALGVSALYLSGAFERLELILLDLRYALPCTHNRPQSVVVVGATREDTAAFGAFPWPRSVYADVVGRLKSCGASVIAFDFFFLSDSKDPSDDIAFAAANRAAENVLLPVLVQKTEGMPIRRVNGAPVWQGGGKYSIHENTPLIRNSAKAQAHINVLPDGDGIVRRIPALMAGEDGMLFPAMSIRAAMTLKGIGVEGLTWGNGTLHLEQMRVPIDDTGTFYVRHLDYERWVHLVSDEEIGPGKVHSRTWREPILHYSFSQVLKRNLDPEEFAGKIVLVGYTAIGQERDTHQTPFGRQFGVLIQAAAIHTLLSGEVLTRVPTPWALALIGSLALVMHPLLSRFRPSRTLIAVPGALCLIAVSAAALFVSAHVIMDCVPCLVVVLLSAGGGLALSASRARRLVQERDLQFETMDHWSQAAISGAHEVESVLLEMVTRSLGARCGLFLSALPDGAPGALKASFGLDEDPALQAACDAADTLAMETAGRRIAISTNPAGDGRLGPGARTFSNILCMPLNSAGTALGFLCLFDKGASPASPRSYFGREDLRLAEALARQGAVALALVRAMDELKQTQARLLQAERLSALGKMTNMIVHDIKNPMQGMRMFAELVADPRSTPEDLAGFSKIICGEIDRLVSLSEELLDFSRGTAKLYKERVGIRRFVEDTLTSASGEAARKHIRADRRLAYDGDVVIDVPRMKRVLLNLCLNAIQTMPEGGELSIGSSSENGQVILTVSDTGPGIAAEIRDRIFEPFVTHGKEGGTGLGLAIARKIVEDHGGTLSARNLERGGAEFRIALPLA